MDENTAECADANEAPPLIHTDVPASEIPTVAPSTVVESTSGHLVEQAIDEIAEYDEYEPKRRKPGPKPMVEQHRMKVVMQFIEGDIPGGELGRLRFMQLTQFTPREKSFLVNHPCFKELYDAMIFDFSMRLEEPTKEQLKLLEILGKRLGLSKPATQVNVQVNNHAAEKAKKNRNVKIEVGPE